MKFSEETSDISSFLPSKYISPFGSTTKCFSISPSLTSKIILPSFLFNKLISLILPEMLVVYVNSPVVELLLYLTESGFIPNDFNISKSLDIVTLSPTEKLLKSIDFLSGIFVAAEIGMEYEKSRVSTIKRLYACFQ